LKADSVRNFTNCKVGLNQKTTRSIDLLALLELKYRGTGMSPEQSGSVPPRYSKVMSNFVEGNRLRTIGCNERFHVRHKGGAVSALCGDSNRCRFLCLSETTKKQSGPQMILRQRLVGAGSGTFSAKSVNTANLWSHREKRCFLCLLTKSRQ